MVYNLVSAVILLSFSIVNGFDYTTRCLYFNKTCVVRCPIMMHPYHTRCDRDTVSQRTCADPIIRPIGFSCGWSRCDCNGALFLDEEIMSCVDYEDCIVKYHKKVHSRAEVGGSSRRKISKKIKVDEDSDMIDRD